MSSVSFTHVLACAKLALANDPENPTPIALFTYFFKIRDGAGRGEGRTLRSQAYFPKANFSGLRNGTKGALLNAQELTWAVSMIKLQALRLNEPYCSIP